MASDENNDNERNSIKLIKRQNRGGCRYILMIIHMILQEDLEFTL